MFIPPLWKKICLLLVYLDRFSSCKCEELKKNCSTPSATNRETSQRFCEIVIGFVGNMFFKCDEISYRTFQKHENSEVQKPPSQLRFSLPSIINMITSNGPLNTETDKTDRNPPITNHDFLNLLK